MIVSKLRGCSSLSQVLMSRALRRWMSSAQGSAHGGHEPNPNLWRRVFFFVCIPAIGLGAVNTYLIEKEHWDHYERPEFKPYEYMRIRTKPFPWGDGNHSLLHNPLVNPLPDGWEELPEKYKKYEKNENKH